MSIIFHNKAEDYPTKLVKIPYEDVSFGFELIDFDNDNNLILHIIKYMNKTHNKIAPKYFFKLFACNYNI